MAAALERVVGPDSGGWYTALCPFHTDRKRPNLRFTARGFVCMACGQKGSLGSLARRLGVAPAERRSLRERVVATYDYRDEDGNLLYQVVRLGDPKGFVQRRPDGAGGWVWSIAGVRRVLYRLPEILAAPRDEPVFVVEGEKDADRLWSLGITATTNAMGAGKWTSECDESLRGRRVVIIPDHDDAGRAHAEAVRRSLDGIAAEVRVLELPDLPPKGDVSDWLDNGGTAEELLRLASLAPASHGPPEPSAPDAFSLTDAGNGELFARLYGDRVRYDHRRKTWLVWSGHWWSQDADGEVRRLAKLAARHRYVAASGEDLRERSAAARFAILSESRQRLDAMLAQAQSEHPISDPGTLWNADPWLLGVENGVVDLRTGRLRPGRPEDRISQHAGARYEPDAPCPRWLRFLEEVFEGDGELIDFIQRAVGYSLTGMTTEQCLFVCYGKGANGKSVLLAVLRALAGDYAYNAPFSLFELRSRSAIPNDLAALMGRRLVTSSETNEGTRLNEARVKALTGCDPITARFLHGEFFTFDPVAKYWLAVNHKPAVADDSHGFWRRVRLIPFRRQFGEAEADDGLVARLMAELPGILAWAVRGALAWQERGLRPPRAVRAATESYRAESDPLAAFIEERCKVGEGLSVPAAQAYKAYKLWASDQGMGERELLSSKAFGSRMGAKFERRHTSRGNVYEGVRLVGGRQERGVKDCVKDCESDSPQNKVFLKTERHTRKNPELPFTTLHASPEDGGGSCALCESELSRYGVDGTPYCERHWWERGRGVPVPREATR